MATKMISILKFSTKFLLLFCFSLAALAGNPPSGEECVSAPVNDQERVARILQQLHDGLLRKQLIEFAGSAESMKSRHRIGLFKPPPDDTSFDIFDKKNCSADSVMSPLDSCMNSRKDFYVKVYTFGSVTVEFTSSQFIEMMRYSRYLGVDASGLFSESPDKYFFVRIKMKM